MKRVNLNLLGKLSQQNTKGLGFNRFYRECSYFEEKAEKLDQYMKKEKKTRNQVYSGITRIPTHTIKEFREDYESRLGIGELKQTATVHVCGRVITKREAGKKLVFYDIMSEGETVQVMVSKMHYQEMNTKSEDYLSFDSMRELINRGDIIGFFFFFFNFFFSDFFFNFCIFFCVKKRVVGFLKKK